MSLGVTPPLMTDIQDQAVRIVLLHDHEGKALVLVPADMLFNLVNVWKHSGRHLQPVRGRDAVKFFGQEALLKEAGQKKLFTLPVYLDESLAAKASLSVIEPYTGLQLEVNHAWLQAHTIIASLGLSSAAINASQPLGDDVEVITRAVERFTTLRIKQRLEDTLGLPALPPSMKRLVEIRSDPLADIEDLVPVVRVDPSLAAQVMSWAASPYYAAPGDIHSVEDAVIRVLGFDLVVNLALGVAMGKLLKVPEDMPRDGVPYWQQAVYTATAAELLCRKMPASIRPKPGMMYLAGLLQNFGCLLLAHLFPPHFSLLSRYIEANPHMPLEHVEKQVLNVSREQIGAWLLTDWSLPEVVCEAIRYHNDLQYDGVAAYEARLLWLANRALRSRGLSDGPAEVISDAQLAQLQLSREQLDAVLAKILANRDELDELVHTIMPSKAEAC